MCSTLSLLFLYTTSLIPSITHAIWPSPHCMLRMPIGSDWKNMKHTQVLDTWCLCDMELRYLFQDKKEIMKLNINLSFLNHNHILHIDVKIVEFQLIFITAQKLFCVFSCTSLEFILLVLVFNGYGQFWLLNIQQWPLHHQVFIRLTALANMTCKITESRKPMLNNGSQ